MKNKIMPRFSQMPAGFMLLLCILSPFIWAKQKLPSPCYLLELSSIGFPAAEKEKDARGINELIFFDNRLYLGYGDAVINTGPTDVIYYDFDNEKFVTEFTVDEEAIHLYQIIDNKLMIPGTDATEDWSSGNVYFLNDTGWVKYRTIPKALHVNYLAYFDGKLFAATINEGNVGDSVRLYFGGVFCSVDDGKTWQISYATPSDGQHVYRIAALAVFEEKLFAFPYAISGLKKEEIPAKFHEGLSAKPYEEDYYLIITEDIYGTCDVLIYDGRRWRCEDLIPDDNVCLIPKPFVFNDRLIMPVIFGEYIDYLSLKAKNPPQAITKLLCFDGKNTKPIKFEYDRLIDVLIKKESLYILINRGDLFYIAVTKNLKDWEYFLIPPIIKNPRCIEFGNGEFYIGAGDGNIFESINSKPIEKFEEIKDFLPQKLY